MLKMPEFFKNKFFIAVTITATMCIYAYLLLFAYTSKFFTVLGLLTNFGFVMPIAIPLFACLMFAKQPQNSDVFKVFSQIWLYFMLFPALTLPFFVMELFINSGMFFKIIVSSYFILALQTAVYTAICVLLSVLLKNIAARTVFSFAAVLAFYIATFPYTYAFYKGFFDGYDAFTLALILFVLLNVAYIAAGTGFSGLQKIMQFVVVAVITVSLHLIVTPLKHNMFIDTAPVPTFVLTEEAKEAVRSLPDNVVLTVYLPKRLIAENPEYSDYAKVLENFLYDLQNINKDKLTIESRVGYFTDGEFALEIFSPATLHTERILLPGEVKDRGDFEKNLMEKVQKAAGVKRKVIGLASTLPLDGVNSDKTSVVPRWAVMNLIRQYYDIVPVNFSADKILDDIDALMIVNPKAANEQQADKFAKAFDDFMQRKGKALIFTDLFSESENAYPLHKIEGEDFTDKLINPFGVSVKKNVLAVNRQNPIYVAVTDANNNVTKEPFIARFGIAGENLNRDDKSLKNVNKINITSGGILEFHQPENKNYNITSLLTSVYETTDLNIFKNLKSPTALLTNALMHEEPAPVAAKISTKNQNNITLFIVADSDMLYNQFWKDIHGNDIADNGLFVLNMLDEATNRLSFTYNQDKEEENLDIMDFQTSAILWIAAIILSMLMCTFFFFILKPEKN
jgi:hypothetical protein